MRHNDPPSKRKLRLVQRCAACIEIELAGLSYQDHTCGRKMQPAPRGAQDALEGGRP